MYYSASQVPTQPLPDALLVTSSATTEACELLIIQLFDKRPVWSLAALRANLAMEYNKYLKKLLPKVAYYFKDGPWRKLWIKFGYDPRLHQHAKMLHLITYK
jgi:general transcription factor 3C polypeptide 5 (transcription factor C subunit 1)